MDFIIWIMIIIIHLLAIALVIFRPWLLIRNKNKNKKKLPPGPKGFPILGSLHLLRGKLPHRDLRRLSQRYGSIMHMKLGLVNTIVVSSPESAHLFLKTHDLIFASRPPNQVFNHLNNGQKDLLFAEYGPYWRNMRKMCTLELLSTHKLNSFQSMRREELGLLIDSLRKETANNSNINGHVGVDISSKVSSLSANMTCLMIFGKKFEDEELDEKGFKWVVQQTMKLAGLPNLADFIPYLGPLDLQGLNRRAKSLTKIFDQFFERIIDEHLQSTKDTKDFVDVMLDIMVSQQNEYQLNRSTIKPIILDMLLAAMDTSATAIEWALAELIKHPQVMKKLQEELKEVVGLNRIVQESDLGHLKYLSMVVKEVLRLHPPGPLLAPHLALEDCIVNNFYIPKQSRVIVNVWAIGRDPNAWIDAEKFLPERFIDSQVDVKGRDFQLIPFGSGRRGCPGMQMGLIVVHLVIAQLVHCFDWKLPNGMLPRELDMTEEFGMTCPRAQNLLVTPIYRLHN